MNVRLTLLTPFETMHLEDDSPQSRITFWSLVEGYRLKGRDYLIEWGSGVLDSDGVEIFESDEIWLYRQYQDREDIIFYEENVSGVVDFLDGAFFVIDDDGMTYEVNDIVEIPGHVHQMKVLGHRINQLIKS
jgi:hypothetical protein